MTDVRPVSCTFRVWLAAVRASVWRTLSVLTVLAASVYSPSALAQLSSERAADHFDRAMDHVQQREYELAVQHFQRAHELEPNHAVLYNLAQVFAEMKRPIDAIRTLHECLKIGGSELEPGRVARIKQLIDQQEQQLTLLRVRAQPGSAEVLIDGAPVSPLPDGSLPVAPGEREVLARAPAHAPVSRKLVAKAGQQVTLEIQLERIESEPAALALQVRCAVHDVDVIADGKLVGTLKGGPGVESVAIPAGSRVVRFRHPFYAGTPIAMATLKDGAVLDCQLKQPTASPVEASTPGDLSRPNVRHDWAVALAGAGVSFGLSAGLIWMYNGERAEEWKRTSSGLCESGSEVVPCDDPDRPLNSSERGTLELRDSIHRWDAMSQGLAAIGALVLSGAVVLYLWPDASRKATSNATGVSFSAQSIQWHGSF